MGRNPQEETLLRDQGRTYFLFPHVARRSSIHHGIITLLEAARGVRDQVVLLHRGRRRERWVPRVLDLRPGETDPAPLG